MKHKKSDIVKYLIIALALLPISFIDYWHRSLFPKFYQPWLSTLLIFAALVLLTFLFYVWFYRPYAIMLSRIDKHCKDMLNEMAIAADSPGSMSIDDYMNNLERLICHYRSTHQQQSELVCQLTSTNKVLDQNNKFANAIVQITSEILRSGDIHSILQLILNKAVEIIPNAQKGSILLYNKDFLEYRAMCGYDMDALKDFKFSINEIFQYNTEDFYAPIIIPDVEEFNRNLKQDKFSLLKESRSFELKSCISCAISVDNQFYGIINIDNVDSSYAFFDEHKPIIKYFAEQIGVALKNAELLEKTLYLSQYDSLTNIYNRAYFEEQLNTLHSNYKMNNQSFHLVLVDMNDLKMINDNYGHEAGDKLITTFTGYISSFDERPDIFGRIGGDEFALVYKNRAQQEVMQIIKSIKQHFAAVPFNYNNKDILNITFGYGISSYPEEAEDLKTLFRNADKLMYMDKKLSKKRIG